MCLGDMTCHHMSFGLGRGSRLLSLQVSGSDMIWRLNEIAWSTELGISASRTVAISIEEN